MRLSPRSWASAESRSEESVAGFCERGVPPVEPVPLGGEVMDWSLEFGRGFEGGAGGAAEGLDVADEEFDVAGMRSWTSGGNIGSSGWRIVEWRRRDTSRG